MAYPLVFVSFVEANANGRIMKIREVAKGMGGDIVKTVYVINLPSRLVAKPVRVKGRFTSQRVTVTEACTMEQRTGWKLAGRFDFLADARASLGINTSPKRPAAVAAALAVEERMAA